MLTKIVARKTYHQPNVKIFALECNICIKSKLKTK